MSDYERIKRSCLRKGELWEDPDFPASQASVFYHQTPPFQFVWKRPKNLFIKPAFVSDTPTKFDVTTGKMGDKWLVSCLGVLYLCKGLFYRVVPADQGFEDPHAGVFRFRLWWCGQWVEVLVDDLLPTVNGKLAFLQTSNSEQLWPALLEKAYAKLHGSYEALKYGSLLDGLADLTGGITESIAIKPDPTYESKFLSLLLKMTSLVTCTVRAAVVRSPSEILPNGIQVGLNYRVVVVDKVEGINNEPTMIVKLSNPLAPGNDYTGSFSVSSPIWKKILLQDNERLELHKMEHGDFWMELADFENTFTHLEVVHLDSDTSRDEPTLQSNTTWQMRLYQGAWRKGVSAGGCRNNPDTFHINPQLQLFLNDPEGESNGIKDCVIVSLNQHSIMEPKVIGFSAYLLPKAASETIHKSFFKRNKSLLNSQYTNSRQVSYRHNFQSGTYLIVPTTFEPGEESNFTMRVFSSRSLKLKLLETMPMILKSAIIKAPSQLDVKSFMQYESVFLQLADEHRTVNAFELQELLDACLPNDYIKSCASMEVCRQVVLTLDSTGSGRLTLSEFKDLMCSLKHWQTAFKTHSREKTGVLRAERLRDALKDVGYTLPEKTIALLVLRYMRKDGTLRFGDFVSAVLHLHLAFSIFETNDTLQNGTIKLNLSEWLKSALMC